MRLLNTVPDHIRPVLEPLLADAELKGYARGVAEGKAAGQSELLSGLKALQYLMPGSPASGGCPVNLSWSQYVGPRGGRGWVDEHGNVLYQTDMPGHAFTGPSADAHERVQPGSGVAGTSEQDSAPPAPVMARPRTNASDKAKAVFDTMGRELAVAEDPKESMKAVTDAEKEIKKQFTSKAVDSAIHATKEIEEVHGYPDGFDGDELTEFAAKTAKKVVGQFLLKSSISDSFDTLKSSIHDGDTGEQLSSMAAESLKSLHYDIDSHFGEGDEGSVMSESGYEDTLKKYMTKRGVALGQAEQFASIFGKMLVRHMHPDSPLAYDANDEEYGTPVNFSQSVPAGAEQVTDDDDVHSLVPEQSGDSDAAAFKMLVMTAVKEAMTARGEDPQPVLDYLSDLLDDPTELRKWMRGKGDATELAWKPAKSKPRKDGAGGGVKAEWDGEGGVQRKPLYGRQAQAALDRQNAFGGDVDDEELAAASKDVGHSDDAKTLAKGRKAAQVHARLMALKPGQFNDGHVKDLEAVLPTLTHKQAGDLRKTLLAHFGEKATLGRTRVERLANIKSHVARLTGAAQQAVQDGMAAAPTPDGVAPSQPTADQPTEAKPKSVQTPADKAQSDIRRDIGAMVGGVPRDTIVNIMRHAGLTPEQVDDHIAAVKAERTAKKGKPAGQPAPSAAPAPEPVAESAPAPAEAASEPTPEPVAAPEPAEVAAKDKEPSKDAIRVTDANTLPDVASPPASEEERQAVSDYRGTTAMTANEYLRGTRSQNEYQKRRAAEMVRTLDGLFARTEELDQPVKVFRWFDASGPGAQSVIDRVQQSLSSGQPVKMAGYSSSSFNENGGRGFGGYAEDGQSPVKFVIDANRGLNVQKYNTDGDVTNKGEQEFLMDRDSSYQVDDISHDDDGVMVVKMRQLSKPNNPTATEAEPAANTTAPKPSGSIEQNPPVEPAPAVAPAAPATPEQTEPEPVTAEPTVAAPEPVTAPKTAPAPAADDGLEPTYMPGQLFDDGETDQKVAGLERAAIRAGLVPDGETLPTGTPEERRNKLYDMLDKQYEENGELSPDLPKSLHDLHESMSQQRAEEEFARENTISDDELKQQQKSEAENQGFYVADGKYVAHPDHIDAAKKRVAEQQSRVDTLEYLQTQKQSPKERDRRAKALSDATSQLAEMQSAVDAIGASSGTVGENPSTPAPSATPGSIEPEAPAAPATPVQPEPAPVAAPEPEPVTAEPTVTAPEPVTPPKTAPAPAADADTAKKVKAAEDAENARRRGRGLRAMSGDERKKFLDGVRAKLAASKPAPTPTEDVEKQAETDQRAKLEQSKFSPNEGAFGTSKPFPDRVQANDGKWYLPDEVTATGPADADAANPPKKDDGMRYGDDNAEVGAQQSLQDLVDGGGDVDAGDFAAISQASGVPVARVKKMHEDLVASTIEDRVREAMAGGKLSADAKAKIAATLKVSPAKVANALKRVGEQDAFIALQDMKAAGEVTADGLKKVAKDTGLTPEQVRKVLQSLDDSSQLGVPDDDAPPPPAPKKPAAKKAKTPTTPPVEPKPKAPARAKPAVVKNALDTIKAFGGNAEGVEGHLSKLSDADRAAVAAKLGVPDGSPADMAKAITGTSAPPPDHDSSVTKAEGETRPSPTTQSAVNQPAPLPAPVPPATSSPNPLAEMTDDEMRAEFERRFGGAKTAKSSESVKDAPAPPHNVLSQGVVNEVHDLLGGKYANIRMAPIHEIREAIRQKFGDQAASRDVFNELLLDMRRQKKIRLTSISDRSRATEQQLNDSVFAVGETFFYVEKTPDTPPKSPIPTTPAADQPTPKKAEGTPTTPPVEPRPKAPAKAKPAKAPTPPEPAKPLTEMTDDELAAELARRKTASPKAAPKPKAPTELSPEHHQQRDDLKSLAEKATKDPDSVSDQEIEDAMTRLQSTKMSDADAKALALAITGVKETTKKKAILAVRGKLTAAKRILEGQKS